MENTHILTHDETLIIEESLNKPDGVIAFPTDTVYGLGCLVENEKAIQKIYTIKGRPSDKPLILMGCSIESLEKYVKFIPEKARNLMNYFWPGALTIILPKSRYVPDYITGEYTTIGLRVPEHPLTIEILKRCSKDMVLATTSANLSGEPDLCHYNDVKNLLANDVDHIVEEGAIPVSGRASTVVTINKDNTINVLRQGAIVID